MRASLRPVVALALGVPGVLGLLELALHGLRGGGHTGLPLYASLAPPDLVPGADVVGLFGLDPYPVQLDARGLRVPSAPRGLAIVGDSVAFGLGLPGEATLAARCTANGHAAMTVAAPAFTLVDALAFAARVVPDAERFVVVVNATDDDAPPLAETAALAGRWLVRPGTPGPVRAALASPLGTSQLLHDGLMVAAARSPAPSVRVGFDTVGRALAAWVAAHPVTTVVWAAPAPAHPGHAAAAADVTALRAHVPVREAAPGDAGWLADGVHWTAAGTAAVADELCPR